MPQGPFLRKYGVQTTINFTLFEVDGVDFRVDGVDAGADCSIMKDEGGEATCVNDFADEGQGYSLVITATEMEAARIVVYVVDSATKVWLDDSIIIETYGNAAAQHAMDLDDGVRGGMTALPNAAANAAGGLPISASGALALDTQLANTNEITEARMGALTDWIDGGRLDVLLDAIPTTPMRGTDSAALASVIGALTDAAAGGDPTTGDTVMQYIKQLINILVGSDGIANFPAEAAPANAVSLAEVIRAIHADVTGLNGSAMIGTNSAALASVATEGRLAELDSENIPSDIDAIPTTAMRGTNSAALASVCTEGRLAELDAANLPADVADVPTVAEILAGVIDGSVDLKEALVQILAYASGNIAKSSNAYAYKERDGVTTAFTNTAAESARTRS